MTWPTSIFGLFALFTPTPYNKQGIYAQRSNPMPPTPESSTDDDDIPSLDTNISSSDPNSSTEVTSDDEWAYPPTPPPLPSLEIPRITIQPLTSVPEDPELELPALDLPLRQFEELQVDSDHASESGMGVAEKQLSIVPFDVEMGNDEENAHQSSTDTAMTFHDNERDFQAHRSTSLPPIETIGDVVLATEDEEATTENPIAAEEERQVQPQQQPPNDFAYWNRYNDGHLTRYQRDSAITLQRSISRLQSHLFPLTAVRFGRRTSHQSFFRLHEAVPKATLEHYFPNFESYTQLANAISSICTDNCKVPNRWQTYIPRIRRIRQFFMGLTYAADEHVRNHGYLEGLKEYVAKHDIEFWHADVQGGGIFYTHEYQFLYRLREFLTKEGYPELTSNIQWILQCTFKQPGDLWAVVLTILGRINPPAFDYELTCEFVPRTDDEAIEKHKQFANFGFFF